MFTVLLSIIFRVFASLFLKEGAISMEEYSFLNIATNYYYFISIIFLALQAVCWQLSLKKFDLNYAYMFNGLFYPLILIVCYFYFGESISVNNIIGMVFISGGITLSFKR